MAGSATLVIAQTVVLVETGAEHVLRASIIESSVEDSFAVGIASLALGGVDATDAGVVAIMTGLSRVVIPVTNITSTESSQRVGTTLFGWVTAETGPVVATGKAGVLTLGTVFHRIVVVAVVTGTLVGGRVEGTQGC